MYKIFINLLRLVYVFIQNANLHDYLNIIIIIR